VVAGTCRRNSKGGVFWKIRGDVNPGCRATDADLEDTTHEVADLGVGVVALVVKQGNVCIVTGGVLGEGGGVSGIGKAPDAAFCTSDHIGVKNAVVVGDVGDAVNCCGRAVEERAGDLSDVGEGGGHGRDLRGQGTGGREGGEYGGGAAEG